MPPIPYTRLIWISQSPAEIFRTMISTGGFFCQFQDGCMYIVRARSQVSELENFIDDQLVKQTTYILMAMFDY